jgi:hypothetical protein
MRSSCVAALALPLSTTYALAQSPSRPGPDQPAPQGMKLDLTQSFHTRSPWRFVVTEGPQVKDDLENDVPGALTLCLHKGSNGPCISGPLTFPLLDSEDAEHWKPHYLFSAKPVCTHMDQKPSHFS